MNVDWLLNLEAKGAGENRNPMILLFGVSPFMLTYHLQLGGGPRHLSMVQRPKLKGLITLLQCGSRNNLIKPVDIINFGVGF